MHLTVWRFLDGNRAHEKQSAALVAGLRASLGGEGAPGGEKRGGELDCFDIPCPASPIARLISEPPQLRDLPQPDFIIGTGRRSRWPMLAARRRYGGRAVAINLPILPFRWFDFAIVPEHDRPPPLDNIILSQGALTEPLPQAAMEPGRGLILLGGPSKHFDWDAGSVSRQVQQLLQQPLAWHLSDSRRTPADTLGDYSADTAEVIDWRDCPPGWVQEQMAAAEQIWVTEDSISMVFESLQSRARVGIIRTASRGRANKVRAAVQRLVDQGLVTDRVEDVALPVQATREPLNQYLVCARALLRRCGLPVRD
ncbi:ELM1/GtrOC1 family putative glycosyltransferase [Microbulbifer magnicolonia]|uniref:ELM1/GtrOC1 family putative glycosyltransferase n=1 Tax=Microbulbifer magnicolonia TaxID=3109744 RepID=UPI002B414F58|nr:ELM1/GtrOC1 family putative glycosyltransferase [Microbulbifer sp. GG15]